ncbi:uncharacterized protein K460DRAFT_191802 [Cucurbitaria berberidis CBS 394.84]|uniref:Secreted protein n=1 Tax=Cucurbitaria berberidis CBS 394.84 TaxID=1168544 RepID=A0A9P4G846_9PLEO|nr:uncharacterized protein K460DRAFT_191802 [Cucurbitaria berberidis CBS 394.84]KAF1840749.1 hypothetical protein K460DRAFT_191802 [Cucurbitaria berberidis CBS 394.84]
MEWARVNEIVLLFFYIFLRYYCHATPHPTCCSLLDYLYSSTILALLQALRLNERAILKPVQPFERGTKRFSVLSPFPSLVSLD